MKLITVLLFLFLVSCTHDARKSEVICSASELEGRSDPIGKNMKISELFKYYSDIDRCKMMDGSIKTGFEEVSTKILSKSFQEILNSKYLNNEKFTTALVKSVNDGTSMERFKEICAHVSKCDQNSRLCKELSYECSQ